MADNNKSLNSQRGQSDPGWNDPPMMQFNPTGQGTNKSKLNLNKRIAFPMTNTVKPTAIVQPSQGGLPLTAIPTQSSQLPVAVVPPMPHSQVLLPPQTNRVPPLTASVVPGNNEDLIDEDEVRDFCLNTFQTHLANVIESSNVRTDEIQRRLNILSQMWLDKELDKSVHKQLLCIAKALQSKNFNDAIENHRILVVNHSNLCLQWATALRQIILTIKNERNNSELESSSNSGTFSNLGNILIPAVNPMAYSDINTTSQALLNSETQSESASNIQHI
ncbi:steroid receptor RNA activator 1-like [Condylostylus longicornis]|uniref:steroid receptor RNA activator 1-like n=1 Tax=Condylostylus longicornis TaxID=2530218 RepID=UPI00244E0867|nr:steroid receptor RNA activator 1-like [Condylostylus longicornis]